MLKKLEGSKAELLHYLIKPLENMVQEEIEADRELKALIMQAKEDIAN